MRGNTKWRKEQVQRPGGLRLEGMFSRKSGSQIQGGGKLGKLGLESSKGCDPKEPEAMGKHSEFDQGSNVIKSGFGKKTLQPEERSAYREAV